MDEIGRRETVAKYGDLNEEDLFAVTVRETIADYNQLHNLASDDDSDDDDDDGDAIGKLREKTEVISERENPHKGRVLWRWSQLLTKADHRKPLSLILQASGRLPTLPSPPLLLRLTPTFSPLLQLASLLLTISILPPTLPPLIPPKRRPTRTSSIRNNRCRSANYNTRRTCKPADSSTRRNY